MPVYSIDKPIEVLLADSNTRDIRFFRKSLAEAGDSRFGVTCVKHLGDTIKRLDDESYDIVMLNPTLPDSKGFDTFISVRMHAPRVPIILLSKAHEEELAVKALQNGAQDCLVKGHIDGGQISRSIRFAIERHRIMADLEHSREKEHRMAYFDALTDLPNRQLFYDRLNQAVSHAQRYDEKLGLMFIDLDGFKNVNDTLGHECGDLLLKSVSERLKDCLRKSDTVARIGGDEFTCIVPDVKCLRNISVVAQKIIRSLARPFDINGNKVYISGSVGASIYPDDTENLEILIKNADMAMYNAKNNGKNNFQLYSGNKNKLLSRLVPAGKNIRTAQGHSSSHRQLIKAGR